MMVTDTRRPKDEREALEWEILFFRKALARVCLHIPTEDDKRAEEIERLSKKLKDLYAKYNGKPEPRTGVELIAEERQRQIEKEGRKIILHLCADLGSDSLFYQLSSEYQVKQMKNTTKKTYEEDSH